MNPITEPWPRRLFFAGCLGPVLFTSLACAPQSAAQQATAVASKAQTGVVDVTATVAALVNNNVLTVPVSTALAGSDPARKIIKKLVVISSIDGRDTATAVVEGQTLKISAPPGKTLTIKKALYGDIRSPILDVTEKIKTAIADNHVSLPVDNGSLIGGADLGNPKINSLEVHYSVGGQPHSITLPDAETLNLPARGDGAGPLIIESATYGDPSGKLDASALLASSFAAAPVMKPPLPRPVLQITPVQPANFQKRGALYFADFGADSYGNLQITFPGDAPASTLLVRLGEKLNADGQIDRTPPGSVNFLQIPLVTRVGQRVYQLQIPAKPRHQNKAAVHTPPEIGEITPFRYVEIENSPVALDAANVRKLFVHTAFDDGASSFHSSDETLNAVWNLCKHTMKATTAFGVFIDGERERIPYEADAYINELSYLACDTNTAIGRATTEHLLANPTWPTEWSFHMPMLAEADYEATGDTTLASRNYEALKGKLMMDKTRSDGLLQAPAIVDWPVGERDGYNDGKTEGQQVGPDINTVANAFYYHALQKMVVLAQALKKDDDARLFQSKAAQVYQAFNAKLFDSAHGIYTDGEGSAHSSLHANMFPLAFGLVPAERQKTVADFVQSRGMACSVYGAQYLLEALYGAGKDDTALQLMTTHDERGWWHMIDLGSTMTLEAWDAKFKGNLTWNHAWGTAPANIIARFLVGVRPLSPGFGKILIAPRPGSLKSFEAKVPTARGPVSVNLQSGARLVVEVTLPPNTSARVSLPWKPAAPTKKPQVFMDKKLVVATTESGALVVEDVGAGHHTFEVQ